MSQPRYIPDSECKQGKCACPTTGCWGECNMKRFPVLYGAPLPAAPAPTARNTTFGLDDNGKLVLNNAPAPTKQLAGTGDEHGNYRDWGAAAPTEPAGELPPLPAGQFYDTPAGPEIRFTTKQMRAYALDTLIAALKPRAAALAARQAPTDAPKESPATPVRRDLTVGDTVRVLDGCIAVGEDFSGRVGVIEGFDCDDMSGVSVQFPDGEGLFCDREDLTLESLAARPTPAPSIAQGAGSVDSEHAEIIASVKEAYRDIAHIENHLERTDAPSTIRNRTIDVRAAIGELNQRLARLARTAAPSEGRTIPTDLSSAATDVLTERQRQKDVEGWTTAHDDAYSKNELQRAAMCYLMLPASDASLPHALWPWDFKWWNPTTYRRNLVKAGALILAEIERLDRATLATEQAPTKDSGEGAGS
jgi:hypothetical protein